MKPVDANQSPKLLLTSRESAELLSISQRTLWSLTNSGAIRSVRIGAAVRYTLEELREFITRQSNPAV